MPSSKFLILVSIEIVKLSFYPNYFPAPEYTAFRTSYDKIVIPKRGAWTTILGTRPFAKAAI